MKKTYAILAAAAVILMLTIGISQAKEKQIYIVHEDMPEWATQTVNGTHYWFTDQYAYGVGIAQPMKNSSLQRITAGNRARTAIATRLNLGSKINGSEIRHFWKNPETGDLYALARMPIKIEPK